MSGTAFTVCARIAEIAPADWDACAGTANPFVSHAFLLALEESGSATAKTGWLPQHLLLRDAGGGLVAAAPVYLKGHSYGEYVFDHGWADAYQRAGGRYYPKLQLCVPFSPVPGPRLLIRPDAPPDTRDLLIRGLKSLADEHNVSSLHVTFPESEDWEKLAAAGFLKRLGVQFHWTNDGYKSFEDFLDALSSRKRKQIRKERREAAESGLSIRALAGPETTPRQWDAFHRFYLSTIDKKWGSAYLKRGFFDLLRDNLADKVVLVMAERDGVPVAGALNLRGEEALYGRNWGSDEDVKFLHFEACYYQAIDFAIRHGLKRVEAGAQGTHKIQRGYLPSLTYSAHLIRDPGFEAAVSRFLDHERAGVAAEARELATLSPFKGGVESEG